MSFKLRDNFIVFFVKGYDVILTHQQTFATRHESVDMVSERNN